MAKRFEYYYLQLNTGPAWETAEQSDSVAALTTGLADHLASSTDAEIRVVGANFDKESESWAYEQLFYIDQSIIDLGISEELDEAGMLFSGTFKDAEPANLALREERHIPADDAYIEGATSDDMVNQEPPASQNEASAPDDDLAVTGHASEDGALPWEKLNKPEPSDTGLSRGRDDDDLDETTPWMRSRAADDDDDEALELAEAYPFDPPRRQVSIGKTLAFVFLFLFLAAGAVAGLLIYFQHPMLLDTADKLGIGQYLRHGPHAAMSAPGAHNVGVSPMAQDEPLTTGQVVRYAGIAPALWGRWSPGKCETTFIEFGEHSYHRSINGQAAAEATMVSEALEDDFMFYLRSSPEVVEQFRKVTANDIQLASPTTKSGYLRSSKKAQIYSRCP